MVKKHHKHHQYNDFNTLISQASEAIMCDSECRKQKREDALKQKYIQSQVNLETAPRQMALAQKKFITFSEGDDAYNDLVESELKEKAQTIIEKFGENFEDEVNKIKTQLETYNGLLINITNVGDLYKKYKLENIELFNELKEDTNDILTNERKTYYEEQNIDRLRFYYSYFMITIYVICVISFGIFSLMSPLKNVGWKVRLSAFIFLIVLPFFSTWILSWVIYLAYQIYHLIPKNVYK
tara:strand:- start:81 stop:797 length:717 start_codon:yes stop_codon:yes gene_type:complete